MNKLDFSGKIIALIGNDLFFAKTSRNVTLGNDINIYLKRKTKGVNLIKIIDNDGNGFIIKAFDNQPKKMKFDLQLDMIVSTEEELVEFLKDYF